MSRISKLRTLPQFSWFVAFVLILAGCTSVNRNQVSTDAAQLHAFGPLTHESQWYLSQIDTAGQEQRFALQVLAARRLILDGDRTQANAIQQQIAKEAFTPRQSVAVRLLQALQLGKQKQSAKALNRIAGIDLRPLDKTTVQFYYRLQADLLLQAGQKTAAANSLISLDSYLSDTQLVSNHQEIWGLLKASDINTLKSYVNAAKRMQRTKAEGWFELGVIAQEPDQTNRYAQWQKQYPQHPAFGLFTPDTNTDKPTLAQNQGDIIQTMDVHKVAVFLPLSGKLSSYAAALKAGIEQANQSSGQSVILTYYDENSLPMQALVSKAQQDGAQLIVGPLQKDKVEALLSVQASVPVLALNQIGNQPAASNLYYYSLSPEDEAAQIAQKLDQDGLNHPLLLVPSNNLGERTIQGFNNYWNGLDKGEATIAKFRSRDELLSLLRKTLTGNISSGQAGQIQSLANTQTADNNHVDSIFMLASAFEAASIKSNVDMMLGDSPVRPSYYLGSKSNSSGLRADIALALNGMQLGDMPWMLNKMPEQFTQAATALPNANGDQMRLYAMGYDTFALIHHLSEMRANPEITLSGLTGTLQITADGVIVRNLLWTRYVNGQLVSNNDTSNATSPAPQPAQ